MSLSALQVDQVRKVNSKSAMALNFFCTGNRQSGQCDLMRLRLAAMHLVRKWRSTNILMPEPPAITRD
jgi:hypothetical protein